MSYDAAVTAIRARSVSLWPGLEAAVPMGWVNEGEADTAGNPLPAHDASGNPTAYIMLEVLWSGGEFVSIGAPGDNLARREGHIWVYAFIPAGSGASRAHQLAAEAAGMFEGQDFSGVVCQAAQPGGPVDAEDGSYYGQSAAVPFIFDETA